MNLKKKAELGDVEVSDEQLISLRLAPNMSPSLLARIKELHGSHRGMKTASAEMRYLETASKLPLYGLHQFHVKDAEEAHIILSVFAGGVMVFEKGEWLRSDFCQALGILLNRFTWGAIIELSYKRSIFYIQVRAGVVSNNVSRIGFLCPTSGKFKAAILIIHFYCTFLKYKTDHLFLSSCTSVLRLVTVPPYGKTL